MQTKIVHSHLTDRAREFNQRVEENYINLALVLVEIEESRAYESLGYDDFASYYRQDLGREKSTVSRLLTVGKWLKANGELPGATVSYKKLDMAIRAFPDKDPQYVLAAARTNTLDELKEERIEAKFGEHDHQAGEERFALCTVCNKFMRLP